MNGQTHTKERSLRTAGERARAKLLAGLPVAERRLRLTGISTPVVEGGDGPPLILLHGPAESAVNWRWVIPDLVTTHRVIAPDLPGHGESDPRDSPMDADRVLAWLGELIERTCSAPPVVVGHVIGGSIAARFAVDHGRRLGGLVLVDSLGLARFWPSPRFAFSLMRFMMRPTERTYDRFMRQCAFDLDDLQDRMGERWDPFAAYNIGLAREPEAKAVGRLMREVGISRIPSGDLARIKVPTTLIWGRHDRANRPKVAEAAARRFGWGLHVIEESADDPPRDQPEAFIRALRSSLDASEAREGL